MSMSILRRAGNIHPSAVAALLASMLILLLHPVPAFAEAPSIAAGVIGQAEVVESAKSDRYPTRAELDPVVERRMLEGINSFSTEPIDLLDGLEIYCDLPVGKNFPAELWNYATDIFHEIGEESVHPERFYIGYSRSIECKAASELGLPECAAKGYHRFYLVSLTPTYMNPDRKYIAPEEARAYHDRFESALDRIVAAAPKELDQAGKAKYAHDWLLANCDYDERAIEDRSAAPFSHWTAWSGIVDGNPICRGYSLAYMAILGRFGIEGEYVYANGHAWTRVKIGGSWFNVDVTWDDPASDRYFLKSDAWWRSEARESCEGTHLGWKSSKPAGTSRKYDSAKWRCLCPKPIGRISISLDKTTLRFNGCRQAPGMTLRDDGEPIVNDPALYKVSVQKKKYGRVRMKVTGRGFYKGTRYLTFKIVKQDISKVYRKKVLKSRKYTGRAVNPIKGKLLEYFNEYEGQWLSYKMKKGRDFTVKYKKNVRPGTARAVIKGKGKFKGKVVLKFKIVKRR